MITPENLTALTEMAIGGLVMAGLVILYVGYVFLVTRLIRGLRPRAWWSDQSPSLCPSGPLNLSHDEEIFLRHWMYDEVHYEDGPGPAKQLQVQHRAIPGDLAILIAAAMPDPLEQEKAGQDRPSAAPPTWPWSPDSLRVRIAEARTALGIGPTNVTSSPGVDLTESPLEATHHVSCGRRTG